MYVCYILYRENSINTSHQILGTVRTENRNKVNSVKCVRSRSFEFKNSVENHSKQLTNNRVNFTRLVFPGVIKIIID